MSQTLYIQITRYSQIPLIVFGTIGSILNQILFFQRKSLRMSSCSLYFRALSVNDLLALYIIVLPLWLSIQNTFDPSTKYDWYCKIKTFITDCSYTISPYLVVLACFDRLCTSSTSIYLRKIATKRVAYFLIPFVILFILILYSHIFLGYELIGYNSRFYCATSDRSYSQFISLFILFFLCLTPPILMIIFCSITLVFLQQQHRRIMPINQTRLRRRDNQLLKMLFVYVTFNIICTVPFAISYVMLMFQQPNYTQLHILLFRLFNLLLNMNFSTSFYVYTLGTPFYRREIFELFKTMKTKLYQPNLNPIFQRTTNGSTMT